MQDSDNQPEWVYNIQTGYLVRPTDGAVLRTIAEASVYLNSLETDIAALRGLVRDADDVFRFLQDDGHGLDSHPVDDWLDRAAKLLTGGKDD